MLPEFSAEFAYAVRNGSGFQRMAAGFMENDAAESSVDHRRPYARGAGIRMQHGNRFFRCRAAAGFRIDPFFKNFKAHRSAGRGGPGLVFRSVGGHSGNADPGSNPPVGNKNTFRIADQHILNDVAVTAVHLYNFGGDSPRGSVGSSQFLRFPFRSGVPRQYPDFFCPDRTPAAEIHRRAAAAGTDRGSGLGCAVQQAFPAGVVGEYIDGFGTFKYPDSGSVHPGSSERLDPVGFQGNTGADIILQENLGEIAAGLHSPGKHFRRNIAVQHH